MFIELLEHLCYAIRKSRDRMIGRGEILKKERQSRIISDLTVGSVSKTLIAFALPMLLANLLQNLYNMVDMIVVGQFVGSTGLAAVSIGSDIVHMPNYIAMGFCNAGQVVIAQFVGAGDKKAVSRAVGTMFTVVMLGSLAFTAILFAGADTFLRLMNTPDDAWAMASVYCLTCYVGMFFMFGYCLVSAILRGMGDSRHPLVFIAIAAVTNLVLDLIFVAGFNWAAFGAALATVIGQAVSFIASIVFLYRRRESFGFDFKLESFKADRFVMKKLLSLGVPMALQGFVINFSMLFVNSYIYAYGIVAAAVTGIGTKLTHVTSVVSMSLSACGGAMIGQCLGAGKKERVPRVVGFSMLVNMSFASLLAAITIIFPRLVFGLFNTDPDVLDMAMIYLPCAVLGYYGFAIRSCFVALINGTGHAKLNLFVGLLDGVVCRIGLALLFGITIGMGIQGFWYGHVLAGYSPSIVGGIYFISGRWKTRKLLITE